MILNRVTPKQAFLKDDVCLVEYETTTPEREDLFEGVPVEDRPAIAGLMLEMIRYKQRLKNERQQRQTAVDYFMDRQHG